MRPENVFDAAAGYLGKSQATVKLSTNVRISHIVIIRPLPALIVWLILQLVILITQAKLYALAKLGSQSATSAEMAGGL